MRLRQAAAVIAASAIVGVLGLASPAHAGYNAVSQATGTWARFISNGDDFEVCDTYADGLTAYVRWEYYPENGPMRSGSHYMTGDAGDCNTFYHDFIENREVWILACRDQPLFYPDNCDRHWRRGVS